LWNIPASQHELPEGVAARATLPGEIRQGKNDFGNVGYGGPAPPRGKAHRYFFKVYALDSMLDLREGATKAQLEQAMKGHIVGSGRLMGTYAR
jgi:Raf kinase inhibitor-like YbhB/YbcL family protein